jgi:hypothetical protein
MSAYLSALSTINRSIVPFVQNLPMGDLGISRSSPLSLLPKDIIALVFSILNSAKDEACFESTCKGIYAISRNPGYKDYHHPYVVAFRRAMFEAYQAGAQAAIRESSMRALNPSTKE